MGSPIKIENCSAIKNKYFTLVEDNYSTSCHIKIGGLIIEKKIRAFMNNNCS